MSGFEITDSGSYKAGWEQGFKDACDLLKNKSLPAARLLGQGAIDEVVEDLKERMQEAWDAQ